MTSKNDIVNLCLGLLVCGQVMNYPQFGRRFIPHYDALHKEGLVKVNRIDGGKGKSEVTGISLTDSGLAFLNIQATHRDKLIGYIVGNAIYQEALNNGLRTTAEYDKDGNIRSYGHIASDYRVSVDSAKRHLTPDDAAAAEAEAAATIAAFKIAPRIEAPKKPAAKPAGKPRRSRKAV